MTLFRALIAAACLLSLPLRASIPLAIAFALCAALSIIIIIAAVHGALIGEPVGAQAYAVLAATIMGCVMWGSMLREPRGAASDTAPEHATKEPDREAA